MIHKKVIHNQNSDSQRQAVILAQKVILKEIFFARAKFFQI